jgi:hypothetical protein
MSKPPTWVLITCGVCVVLCILSSVFGQHIAMWSFGRFVSKFDKDFEDRMTKEVMGKDEATARKIVLAEVERMGDQGEGPTGGKVDLRAGEGLQCPSQPPNMNDGADVPIVVLIHTKNAKATGVTMCFAEYLEDMKRQIKGDKEI